MVSTRTRAWAAAMMAALFLPACGGEHAPIDEHAQLMAMVEAERAERGATLVLVKQFAEKAAGVTHGTAAEIESASKAITELQAQQASERAALAAPVEAATMAKAEAEATERTFHEAVFHDARSPRSRGECGENGCGESCGTCELDQLCYAQWCRCIPKCAERACGDNGCGGSCGSCGDGERCNGESACVGIIVAKTETVSQCEGSCATGQGSTVETTRVVEAAPRQKDHAARIDQARAAAPLTSSAALTVYLAALDARVATNQGYSADVALQLDQRIGQLQAELPLSGQRVQSARVAVAQAKAALNEFMVEARKRGQDVTKALKKARANQAVKVAEGALSRARRAVSRIDVQVEDAEARLATALGEVSAQTAARETLSSLRLEAQGEKISVDNGQFAAFAVTFREDGRALNGAADRWASLGKSMDALAQATSYSTAIFPEGVRTYPSVAAAAKEANAITKAQKGIGASITAWRDAAGAVEALVGALESVITAYPSTLRKQRIEALDERIADVDKALAKAQVKQDEQKATVAQYHAVLDAARATVKRELESFEAAVQAARGEEAVELLDKIAEEAEGGLALVVNDLTARQQALEAAVQKSEALAAELSAASDKRELAARNADDAAELKPQLARYRASLAAKLPAWQEAEQTLAAATAAQVAAVKEYEAALSALTQKFAGLIGEANAKLAALQAPFASARSVPGWSETGTTCPADSAPLVESSYCRLGSYTGLVDAALERRVAGWKALEPADQARHAGWPAEIVTLDNLSVLVHELANSTERLRGLGVESRAARAEAADL